MKISPETLHLMRLRDAVDERFVHYASMPLMIGNYESLSQLALIAGRLDTIIRRNLASERQQQRGEALHG